MSKCLVAKWVSLSLCCILSGVACSPKIYLIDRQTVLEDEAAGEWPEFEKELFQKMKANGPTPFAKVENSNRKNRLFQVLNGEFVTPAQVAKESQ